MDYIIFSVNVIWVRGFTVDMFRDIRCTSSSNFVFEPLSSIVVLVEKLDSVVESIGSMCCGIRSSTEGWQ